MAEVFSSIYHQMEPILRSAQILKQEAEGMGLQRKDIAEYVTKHQTLAKEERAAWKMQAQADVEQRYKQTQKRKRGQMRSG